MIKAARPHDEATVELLREDPAFADEYLATALYRALPPKGNPRLETLLAVLSAAGLRLVVTRREALPV